MQSLPKITLYTDGSCVKNLLGKGGAAAILKYMKNGKQYEKRKAIFAEQTTNNRMELSAIILGLQMITEPSEITIYSDSKYIINAFNKHWIEKWKKINWDRGEKGGLVKNKELWEEMLMLLEPHIVRFEWVKGHNGDYYNEECDRLAQTAAKTQKSSYKEGTVSERTFLNPYKNNCKKKMVLDIDYKQSTLEELNIIEKFAEERYIILLQASLIPRDNVDKQGRSKSLLSYKGFVKVYESTFDSCKSVNEVLLKGMLEAISKIRYRNKYITVIVGTSLGFAKPEKSQNYELICEIANKVDSNDNILEVIEVFKGASEIKQIIAKYRN